MEKLNGIPTGNRCYRSVIVKGIVQKRLCPYWSKLSDGARCEYLGREAKQGDDSLLIWDQVKECGVNIP